MDRRWFLAALALASLGAGCAARRPSYLLMRGNGGAVLLPPGVSKPDLARRRVTAGIATGRNTCPPGGNALRTSVRGKRLRIEIDRDALAGQPQGWLWNWTAEAESRGCIVPGEGLPLVSKIVEAVPLAPAAADGLLRSRFSHSTVEIGPESRLQVVTPIVRDGAGADKPLIEVVETSGRGTAIDVGLKASRDLLGFETAWYRFTPKPGGGFSLTPLSAERSIEGRTESAAAPAATFLRFSPEASYYRLFLKADLEGKAVTQMLIAAPARAELNRRVRAIDADPALCGAPGALCAVVPRRAAVNVWTAVEVNGREIRVRPGGTVRSAIEAAGEKNAAGVLPRLALERPYAGRLAPVEFDRSAPDILGLALAGGERIRF